MQTATAASFPQRAAAPSWSAYPAPQETVSDARYEVRFAQNAEELDAILKLHFKVFNLELGEGLEESYLTQRDQDEFDACCHHLIVADKKIRR